MDKEKIKILQSKIPINLTKAIKLLKEKNGNIEECEIQFHNDNINFISTQTESSFELAKENYEFCKYDIEKTIYRINFLPVLITTRENKKSKNEIGFVLTALDEDLEYCQAKKTNNAFIPTQDFDYVIKEFESVFPLDHPWNGNIEECFDICGHNFFDKKTSKIIIEKIKNSKSPDEKIQNFKQQLIDWMEDKLEYAEYLSFYGNL